MPSTNFQQFQNLSRQKCTQSHLYFFLIYFEWLIFSPHHPDSEYLAHHHLHALSICACQTHTHHQHESYICGKNILSVWTETATLSNPWDLLSLACFDYTKVWIIFSFESIMFNILEKFPSVITPLTDLRFFKWVEPI